MTDEERGPGSWRYAVRQTDEDGEVILWTSWTVMGYEPFSSADDAHSFAAPFAENYEVVRAWIPEPEWEVVS